MGVICRPLLLTGRQLLILLYTHMPSFFACGWKENGALWSVLIRKLILFNQGLTFWTLSNLNYLLKALFPNTVMLKSPYEFLGDVIQSILIIINMLELKSVILFFCILVVTPGSHSSVFSS